MQGQRKASGQGLTGSTVRVQLATVVTGGDVDGSSIPSSRDLDVQGGLDVLQLPRAEQKRVRSLVMTEERQQPEGREDHELEDSREQTSRLRQG